jgi:hypothetical protein
MAFTVALLLAAVLYTGLSLWLWRGGKRYRRGVVICMGFAAMGFVLGIANLTTGVFH